MGQKLTKKKKYGAASDKGLPTIEEKPRVQRFDPYQIFEVEHRPCLILTVKVVCGRNITKGWADYVDTPDPYVKMTIRTSPEGRKSTSVKDNEVNPVWNESFTFLLDGDLDNQMEITLMEANYITDEVVGTQSFNIAELERNVLKKKTIIFNGVSEIDFEMFLSLDKDPTLRYSLCLCDEEKEFVVRRREKVREGMCHLLGSRGPQCSDEVPNIAVIGSGGGFRAMVGLSGVVKALHDSELLKCVTYICGLSGSSWYISTLYSHEDFPAMAPGDMQEELKNNIDSSLLWLLTPQGVYRYMDRIMKKRQQGQPVSFTDFFGHMVGETLLKERLECRLSEQQEKISDGSIPMPLLTCVHVKKDRSARSFQEWVEFSPYEIGLAKYGTFMKTELFGSKFFMGKLCKKFEEAPLHFLQGIWGSAFCILFKRLLDDNRRLDPVEMIRQEMAKQLEENQDDESSDSSDEGDVDDGDNKSASNANNTLSPPVNGTAFSFDRAANARKNVRNGNSGRGLEKATPPVPRRLISTRRTKQKGYWYDFLKGVFENKKVELLSTRAGRAGVIHNFMRGLSLQQSFPLSPFTPLAKEAPDSLDGATATRASDDFDGLFEMHPTNVKHLYMVDAGLTFNSPYPVVLRPQREVDIILSFDFSARPSDSTPPFKELLLAAKWAKKHKVPFPTIDTTVFDREGMKELYIFQDPSDPHCPTVLHFCLVNVEFRKFTKPGIRRKTKEERDFADFDIFDDQATPFSTFNFKYSHQAFERLSNLTEFNTLLNVEKIKDIIAEAIVKKRSNPVKMPCQLEDIPRLRRVSQKNKNRLSKFVSRIRSGHIRATKKDIDKSIEKDKITEETSVDLEQAEPNRLSGSGKGRLSRQVAVTRRSPRPVKRGMGSTGSDEMSSMEYITPETSSPVTREPSGPVRREIPGRSRPVQPDKTKLWQDSKCNSIDEDDERFYTAMQ